MLSLLILATWDTNGAVLVKGHQMGELPSAKKEISSRSWEGFSRDLLAGRLALVPFILCFLPLRESWLTKGTSVGMTTGMFSGPHPRIQGQYHMVVKNMAFSIRKTCVQIPPLALVSCVAGK